jgi:hypothetical protein
MTEAQALHIAKLRGGDADHHTISETTLWLDLDSWSGDGQGWRALVWSRQAAETTAHNTGAELVSCEKWDGSPFGDGNAGTVQSPRTGVLSGPRRFSCGPLPEGWSWVSEDCTVTLLVSRERQTYTVYDTRTGLSTLDVGTLREALLIVGDIPVVYTS